jgi:hypothetical protein
MSKRDKMKTAGLILLAVAMFIGPAISKDIGVNGTDPLLTQYTPGAVLVFPSAGDEAPWYNSTGTRHFYAGDLSSHPQDAPKAEENPLTMQLQGAQINHTNDYTEKVLNFLQEDSGKKRDNYIETPTEAQDAAKARDWTNHRYDWSIGPKQRV